MDDSFEPIDQGLRTAYQATTYRVQSPRFDLRIGQVNLALDQWLAAAGFQTWCIITAYHPGSKQRSEKENELAQGKLMQTIDAAGFPRLPAINQPDAPDWPPEPSMLVLQCSQEQALQWAKDFGQRAVVYGGLTQAPELLWT
ncbi:MAG: DUF3293 domain-containing protein [Bacteroidota bacterium]